MDENLYDEFGNYVGPDLENSSDADSSGEEQKSDGSASYQQINTVSDYFYRADYHQFRT